MLAQDVNKPNCCEMLEAKLNEDINWCITFKGEKIMGTKLKWFQIRLVHRMLDTNVVLKYRGIDMTVIAQFVEIK